MVALVSVVITSTPALPVMVSSKLTICDRQSCTQPGCSHTELRQRRQHLGTVVWRPLGRVHCRRNQLEVVSTRHPFAPKHEALDNEQILRSFLIQTLTALFCGILFMVLWSAPKPVVNQHDNYQALKPSTSAKVDYFEIAGFAVTITSLLASIELFGKDKFVPASMLLLVALASGVLFMLFEAYFAERPLIPLSLIKTTSSLYFAIQMLLLFSYQAVCLR